MLTSQPEIEAALAEPLQILGYDGIRPGQVDTLAAAMNDSNDSDILSILPTGGGKTALFVLPALWRNQGRQLNDQYQTLVISPLIALQEDQATRLRQRKVIGVALNSHRTEAQARGITEAWSAGHVQFLYTSPEKLMSKNLRWVLRNRPPSFVVIDEVHSADTWGDDFRPAYSQICEVIDSFRPVKVMCLTATLTPDAEANIIKMLGLRNVNRIVSYTRRDNLVFETKIDQPLIGVGKILTESKGSTIAYCSTVKSIEDSFLPVFTPSLGANGGVVTYHGKMTKTHRETSQRLFMSGQAKYVLATNAFGMGVDKADVRMVAHLEVPSSIEGYAQEAGRGGRDGENCRCVLAWSNKSVATQLHFIERANPPREMYILLWDKLLQWAAASSEYNRSIGKGPIVGKLIRMTLDEMCFQLQSMTVPAALAQLVAMGYVDRGGLEKTSLTATVINASRLSDNSDIKLVSALAKLGDNKIALADFADHLSFRTIKLLEARLDRLQQDGVISYKILGRGKTTCLRTESIESMDWDKLQRKQEKEMKVLSQMLAFAGIEDKLKHEALEHYFATGDLPQ